MSERRPVRGSRARSQARKLAMQALYQWQMTGQSAAEITRQFADSEEAAGAGNDYFRELVSAVIAGHVELDLVLAKHVDRPLSQLDPVEHAILLIGLYELERRLEVPYRVVINEAVELARRFGATDGHKYVNAVLDRVARDLRQAEREMARSGG
jgi:N utilization substance protein B